MATAAESLSVGMKRVTLFTHSEMLADAKGKTHAVESSHDAVVVSFLLGASGDCDLLLFGNGGFQCAANRDRITIAAYIWYSSKV